MYSVEVVSDSGFFSSIRNYIAIIRNTDTGKSKEVHLGKSVKAQISYNTKTLRPHFETLEIGEKKVAIKYKMPSNPEEQYKNGHLEQKLVNIEDLK